MLSRCNENILLSEQTAEIKFFVNPMQQNLQLKWRPVKLTPESNFRFYVQCKFIFARQNLQTNEFVKSFKHIPVIIRISAITTKRVYFKLMPSLI